MMNPDLEIVVGAPPSPTWSVGDSSTRAKWRTRPFYVYRGGKSYPWFHYNKAGNLVRFKSRAAAQKRAEALNKEAH